MDYFVALYRKNKGSRFAKVAKIETDINLSPESSLKNLNKRGKKIISTEKWDSISKDAHDKAFTVANVMSADIVQEVFDYVHRAIEDGWSFDKFKKQISDGDLLERMTKAGWTGGENPQRLKRILDTNIKMSFGKGKYQKLKSVSEEKPYWIYHQVERGTKRHGHSKWNGRKFRHDDPIWDYIYPPSAFLCSCWVEATADPTGVEDGSPLIDDLKDNPDYKLCPTKQWQPDTSKYNDRIQKALDKMLNQNKPKYEMSDEYNKLFSNPKYDILNDASTIADIELEAKNIFGKNISLNDLAKMTGAMDGCQLKFSKDSFNFDSKDYDGIRANIYHPEFSKYCRIFYNDNGVIKVHNDYFKPNKKNNLPKGIGSMALFKEVEECRKYGVEIIDTWAYGNYNKLQSGEWSGYYVWPSIGFNAPIPSDFIDTIKIKSKNSPREIALLDLLLKSKSMNDIMKNDDLKLLWKMFGDNICTQFNTKADSEENKFLLNVLEKRKILKPK